MIPSEGLIGGSGTIARNLVVRLVLIGFFPRASCAGTGQTAVPQRGARNLGLGRSGRVIKYTFGLVLLRGSPR